MDTFEALEVNLHEALSRLYDPAYRPPELLCLALTGQQQPGVEAVWRAIIQAIEELKPVDIVPPNARSHRLYQLLRDRYRHNLPQEEVAEKLGITTRHLRREQNQAIHVLALNLWDRYVARWPERVPPAITKPQETVSNPEWLEQARQELQSLRYEAPGAIASVREVVERAIGLSATLTGRHGITVTMGNVPPDLIAAIHANALQQTFMAVLKHVVQLASTGPITVDASREAHSIIIELAGQTTAPLPHTETTFLSEFLEAQGGSLDVNRSSSGQMMYLIELPAAGRSVLVIDDNADLVHLYRRFVTGTRYQIVHVAQGQQALEVVQSVSPDVVVLDIMLPDVDAWALLASLHEHPATRAIPIVICSVLAEEELALSLGAALFIAKPVQRETFLRALDQALRLSASIAPTFPTSTPTSA
jgi:CheY-like chemotaxis protein